MRIGLMLVFTTLLLIPLRSSHAWQTSVSLDGARFRVNGELFDMWGIRVASALGTDAYTNHLIAQLDDYLAHGVNTVTPFYMGSSGGHYDPFTSDGTGWRYPEYRDRMDRIIEACDARGMVVVVGIFYQWKDTELTNRSLADWNAAKEAVRTVAGHLLSKGYTNVIINIANEQNSSGYGDEPWSRVSNVSDLLECCRIAKQAAPSILVGGGGYDHNKNRSIGLSSDVDVLLFDTKDPENSGSLSDGWLAAGINKPHVNVELFGGWTKRFTPCGDFSSVSGMNEYFTEVDRACTRPALSVFFHANPWCQGPSVGCDVRFDLAGQGTSGDRGVHWYFDYVKSVIDNGCRGAPSDTSTDIAVTRLMLINADTDQEIRELVDGDVMDLQADGANLSVRADVSGDVGSVRFEYDEDSFYRIESAAPYTIAGDGSGGTDYFAWAPTVGRHTLSATPYSESGGNGLMGTKVAVNFSVVDGAVSRREVVSSERFRTPTFSYNRAYGFRISTPDLSSPTQVVVVNALGEIVLRTTSGSGTATVPAELEKGAYFVRSESEDVVSGHRLLVR